MNTLDICSIVTLIRRISLHAYVHVEKLYCNSQSALLASLYSITEKNKIVTLTDFYFDADIPGWLEGSDHDGVFSTYTWAHAVHLYPRIMPLSGLDGLARFSAILVGGLPD